MPASSRFHCPAPLLAGAVISLPSGAARHVQVLRLQPGQTIVLFGGQEPGPLGGECEATIVDMGRHEVRVRVGRHDPVEREPTRDMLLAIGMPANERMDWLVEKATELGVAGVQPLMTERSVVRLDEQRARRKTAHWQSIAVAACEQCGRNRVPVVSEARHLSSWVRQPGGDGARLVLSLRPDARNLRQAVLEREIPDAPVTLLLGPEGGLGESEQALAMQHGFVPVSLGRRVFRSETAALVALTLLG